MYNTTLNNPNWDNSTCLNIDKLKAIVDEFKEIKIPYCIAMTSEFYDMVKNQSKPIDKIPSIVSVRTELLSRLPVPWKAYYSQEEYLLDYALYGSSYSPTKEING